MRKIKLICFLFAIATLVFAENVTNPGDEEKSTVCLHAKDRDCGICTQRVNNKGYSCVVGYIGGWDCFDEREE